MGKGEESYRGWVSILKTLKQLNSNLDLNSNTSKQCTGIYAIVNSYVSLIN
jgi:hypothetical protein